MVTLRADAVPFLPNIIATTNKQPTPTAKASKEQHQDKDLSGVTTAAVVVPETWKKEDPFQTHRPEGGRRLRRRCQHSNTFRSNSNSNSNGSRGKLHDEERSLSEKFGHGDAVVEKEEKKGDGLKSNRRKGNNRRHGRSIIRQDHSGNSYSHHYNFERQQRQRNEKDSPILLPPVVMGQDEIMSKRTQRQTRRGQGGRRRRRHKRTPQQWPESTSTCTQSDTRSFPTPQENEEFFLSCDETTNTPKDMDLTIASFPTLCEKRWIENDYNCDCDYDLENTDSLLSISTKCSSTTQTSLKWLTIANEGHKSRQEKESQVLKEYQRYQHELQTCTRLEQLGGGQEVPAGNEGADSSKSVKDDEGKRELKLNVLRATSTTVNKNKNMVKSFNTIHLRERFVRALDEKRRKDEKAKSMLECNLQKNPSEDPDSNNDGASNSSSKRANLEPVELVLPLPPKFCHLHSKDEECIALTKRVEKCLLDKYPLPCAILQNDESVIKDLLSRPPASTLRDESFSLASLENHFGSLPLVDCGTETNVTILFFTILLDRPHLLKLLLDEGRMHRLNTVTAALSLDAVDDLKRSPLMMACEYGLDDCVQVLFSYGPRITAKHPRSGDTALHVACQSGAVSTVKLLLVKGNPSSRQRLLCSRNRKGETALFVACAMGHIEIVEAMFSICTATSIHKALITTQEEGSKTPLLIAIETGAFAIVRFLLYWRGNQRTSLQDNSKGTIQSTVCPLTLAVSTRSLAMVNLLIECGDHASVLGSYCYIDALCRLVLLFEDRSEDDIEIVTALIEAGADPHATCNSFQTQDDGTTIFGNSPLALAACKGHIELVSRMIDDFARVLKSEQDRRRHDPILRKQPISYFEKIELKEDSCVKLSIQDTLAQTLLLTRKPLDGKEQMQDATHLQSQLLNTSLTILKRGMPLSEDGLSRILKSVWGQNQFDSTESLFPKRISFEAIYEQITLKPAQKEKEKQHPYARSFGHRWSSVLCRLNWIWEDQTSFDELYCPYLRNLKSLPERIYPVTREEKEDQCLLLLQGKNVCGHKSILSSKSHKLEAAVRFGHMSSNEYDDSAFKTRLDLDISPSTFRLIMCHIYHGSIIMGLSADRKVCCKQLIDLYGVAEEYLCPSLKLECEMRLISKNPYQCFCWHCCSKVKSPRISELKGNKGNSLSTASLPWICHYCVPTDYPNPVLLMPDNLLQILSFLQERSLQCLYDDSYQIAMKGPEYYTILCEPLMALKSIVLKLVLLNFSHVLKSDDYIDFCHNMIDCCQYLREEHCQKDTKGSERCHLSFSGNDPIGTLLLQTCLEEIVSVPPKLYTARNTSKTRSEWITTCLEALDSTGVDGTS